jgi:hypothetical protein
MSTSPDHPVDQLTELMHGERLPKNRCPRLSEEDSELRIVCLPRDERDTFQGLRMVTPDVLVERLTVHFWHAHIGQDYIERIAADALKAIFAVLGSLYVMALHDKDVRDGVSDLRLVIDDQDARTPHRLSPPFQIHVCILHETSVVIRAETGSHLVVGSEANKLAVVCSNDVVPALGCGKRRDAVSIRALAVQVEVRIDRMQRVILAGLAAAKLDVQVLDGLPHGSLKVARLISARLTGSRSFIIWNVEISDEMLAMSAIARAIRACSVKLA